jgi:F0F1-type ATP synthase beta subunit
MRLGLTALIMAEYFWDFYKQDVLLSFEQSVGKQI